MHLTLTAAACEWLLRVIGDGEDPHGLRVAVTEIRKRHKDHAERLKEITARANCNSFYEEEKGIAARDAKKKSKLELHFLDVAAKIPPERRAALLKAALKLRGDRRCR